VIKYRLSDYNFSVGVDFRQNICDSDWNEQNKARIFLYMSKEEASVLTASNISVYTNILGHDLCFFVPLYFDGSMLLKSSWVFVKKKTMKNQKTRLKFNAG